MKQKINNCPEQAEKNYKYIVARLVDGAWWYWGAWNDFEKAWKVTTSIGGAIFPTDLTLAEFDFSF